MDRIVDFVFLMDIFVNFRSAWKNEDGAPEFDPRRAAIRYLKSWFILDVVTIFPFDALVLFPTIDQAPMLRIPRLLRLGRLAKVIRIVAESDVVKRFEETTSMKYGHLRLVKFTTLILIIAHVCIRCFCSGTA